MKSTNTVILLIAVISTLAFGFIQPATANGATTIAINPTTTTLSASQIGATFKVNITVTDVTNLWDWKVRLNWNPQVLNLTNVEEGPFLKSGGSTLFTWPEGASQINQGYLPEIYCALFVASGVNGSGVLATITFKVLTSGDSIISMNETWLNTFLSPISHTVADGYVVIPEPTPSPSPTPSSSPEPTPPPEESQLFFFSIVAVVAFALIGIATFMLKKRK